MTATDQEAGFGGVAIVARFTMGARSRKGSNFGMWTAAIAQLCKWGKVLTVTAESMNMTEISSTETCTTSMIHRRSHRGGLLMTAWMAVAVCVVGQDAAVPPVIPPPVNGGKGPPPMRRPGGPKAGGPGKMGEGRFTRPGSNMSPMQTEGFEKLPDDDKKRVRAAIDKAWTLPALQQAKDRYIRASEEFRATMRRSLEEVDPEVVKILEKIKPEQPTDPRPMPKLPPPTDSAFATVAVDRLGMEMMAFVRPEQRTKIRALHEKVMQQPEVANAVKGLLEATPEKRVEALGMLREVYRQAMAKEIPNAPRPPQRATSADASTAPTTPVLPPGVVKP